MGKLLAIVLFLVFYATESHADRIPLRSLLDLPPAMERLYGDARVHRKRKGVAETVIAIRGAGGYDPRQGILSPQNRSYVVVKGELPDEALPEHIACRLLEDFYDRVIDLSQRSHQERRLRLAEFLPVSRERFVEWGSKRILEGSSSISWFDAWWTIRMGLPQTPDPSHQLIIVCLHFDYDGKKETLGHFCFGLRERGGNPDRDLIFDFRAPWYLDRMPTVIEGMNLDSSLEPLEGFSVNLYDWIYTQTSYRHCYVQMWFRPVTREQVAVLRAFHANGKRHSAGHFKALRKNCASLGIAFLDRLGPFTDPVSLGKGVADIPTKTAERYARGEFPFYQLENDTHESGREPSARSKVYDAKPTRRHSRGFLELREVAGIN